MKKKIAIFIFVLLGLALISSQVYFTLRERNQLKADINDLNNRLQSLQKENSDLRAEIEYYSHPENLEKELRAKFNYHKPDEKMLIIIP